MPNASDFAGWVFRLDHPTYGKGSEHEESLALKRSAISHAAIESLRLWLPTKGYEPKGDWELEFVDDGGQSDKREFIASTLIKDGKPLACRPDVVFLEKESGRHIVVERKTHRVRKLRDLSIASFPNVWAQLWCYSRIDDWWPRTDTLLVSEIWKLSTDKSLVPDVEPRRAFRSIDAIEADQAKLFSQWGGTVKK